MNHSDYISIHDLSVDDVKEVLDLAAEMKANTEKFKGAMEGKTLALLFEKPSLRTRVTFEVAMTKLSGASVYLAPSDVGLGKRESTADIARNLERWIDVISARTFAHETVTDLAEYANVPVINALTDRLHPCQALADYLTCTEHLGDLSGKRLAYIGDGNNVAHSLLLGGPKVGMDVTVITPEGFEPLGEIMDAAKMSAADAGTKVETTTNLDAVEGANAVYTDVWASMGQESEAEERARIFKPYQVNGDLMARAADGAIFMHCLPAHRGEEVTDEVCDAPYSVIFDEAENRLWTQMAVIYLLAVAK
jgi:ornithine carbamoyltransferase